MSILIERRIKLTKNNLITWSLIILTFVSTLGVFIHRTEKLENTINSLMYSQDLILRQLEVNEKDIKNINNEVKDIDALIDKYSKQFGVNRNLAHAVAQVESNKNQSAISKSGAVGIMQVLPSTSKAMGINNPYNTEDNIKAGIKYLKYLQDKFDNNTDLVLSAYNAGEGNVMHNNIPISTKHYVHKVKKEKNKLDNKY